MYNFNYKIVLELETRQPHAITRFMLYLRARFFKKPHFKKIRDSIAQMQQNNVPE